MLKFQFDNECDNPNIKTEFTIQDSDYCIGEWFSGFFQFLIATGFQSFQIEQCMRDIISTIDNDNRNVTISDFIYL